MNETILLPNNTEQLSGQNLTDVAEQEELNLLHRSASITGLVMMIIAIFLSVFLATWVIWNRSAPVVKQMQPVFLVLICVGSLIQAFAIYPLGLNDQNVDNVDAGCMAWLWLTYMGSSIIYSALFSKLWRVNQIFLAQGFQKKVVTVKDVMGPLIVLLTFNVTVLILMTTLSPRVWVRKPFDDSSPYNTLGYCEFENDLGQVFEAILGIGNFAALVFLCIQAYRARDIKSEFSEARGVSLALFTWVNTTLIVAPTSLTLQPQDADTTYMLYVTQQFVNLVSLLFFIFFPIMLHHRKRCRSGNRASTHTNTRITGLNLDTPSAASYVPTPTPSGFDNGYEQHHPDVQHPDVQHPNVPTMVLELQALRARVAELEQQIATPNQGETQKPAEGQE